MELYPLGTFPSAQPQWFADIVGQAGMDATQIPLWHLDKKTDMSNPGAYLLRMPPGYVLFRHGHPCERFEVVLQGTLEVGDGRTAGPGDIFTADAGSLYGPHTAGPDGCTTLEIFSEVAGMFRLLYEGDDGQIVEANALRGEIPPGYVPLPGDAEISPAAVSQ